jgi:hypothetical protein
VLRLFYPGLISSVLKKNYNIYQISSEGGTWERQTCGARRLTFKNLVSHIEDGRTATLQMMHYIYIFFFNKYKY